MQIVLLEQDIDFYIRIFNSILQPIFVKDDNFKYVIANQAFCDLVGFSQEEILGKTDDLLFPLEDYKVFREKDLIILNTGIPNENEEYATVSDGSRRKFLTTKSLLTTRDGKKYVLGITVDITEKTKILARLNETESLIRTLVDNSPNLIMIHTEGKILFTNQSMNQLLCHPGGEFIAKDGTGLYKKTGQKTMKSVLVYLANQAIIRHEDIELQFKSYNGADKYFLLKNSTSSYQEKKTIMSSLVDITEGKNLESYVLNKILETEDRDRRKFAADLHDDLGPLLSSVKIHLGLEENLTDPSKLSENIRICNDLLKEAIEKIHIISNNVMPGIIDNYGLDAAITSFIQTLKVEEKLSINFIPALKGERFAKEIELHLFRIICELLNNTIKHSDAMRVNIRLRYSGNCLSLLYYDDGKGYNVEEILKNPTGMGISNLYYRVGLIGGELDFIYKEVKTFVRIRKKFR